MVMKVLSITKNGGVELHAIGVFKGTVANAADLANVPAEAQEGSMFHTVGYDDCWEKSADGSWKSLVTGQVVTPSVNP